MKWLSRLLGLSPAPAESHLKAHPLGRGAKVVIRKGPPGAPEREVRISG